MGEPYLGKDAGGNFKEYKLFWSGTTKDVTFTVGHECAYGTECLENGKEGELGTCMTKEIIITATEKEEGQGEGEGEGEGGSEGGEGEGGGEEQAIEEIESGKLKVESGKILYQGRLYILRNGRIYNTLGFEI